VESSQLAGYRHSTIVEVMTLTLESRTLHAAQGISAPGHPVDYITLPSSADFLPSNCVRSSVDCLPRHTCAAARQPDQQSLLSALL
jgi:hypothetical protein